MVLKNKFILVWILMLNVFFQGLVYADEYVLPLIDVTMGLGFTNDEILIKNNNVNSLKKSRARREGISNIHGPMNFHFSYGDHQLLNFQQAKSVIYPVMNYKVDYIHLYPQMNYVKKNEMYKALNLLSKNLKRKGWLLHDKIAGDDYDGVLISSGKKDYAYYRYRYKDSLNHVHKLELVMTGFRDLTVLCSPRSKTKKEEANCPNRFIRVGLYSVK